MIVKLGVRPLTFFILVVLIVLLSIISNKIITDRINEKSSLNDYRILMKFSVLYLSNEEIKNLSLLDRSENDFFSTYILKLDLIMKLFLTLAINSFIIFLFIKVFLTSKAPMKVFQVISWSAFVFGVCENSLMKLQLSRWTSDNTIPLSYIKFFSIFKFSFYVLCFIVISILIFDYFRYKGALAK